MPRSYYSGCPDLAVEVRSPDDTRKRVHTKALSWLHHGARMVWVVDPLAESVTVYRGRNDVHELGGEDVVQGGDVVPGFCVRVRDLFPTDV